MKISPILLLMSGIVALASPLSFGQGFTHPGLNQTAGDLSYMKQQVLAGKQPYKDAFERLKSGTDPSFEIKPHTHVQRGPYGRPNIGGDDLSKGANMAYNCALIWYITGEKAYATKAIDIINAWSDQLWDFDYNDAKLLAAWTGHQFCNAAEILRYTPGSGWQKKDTDRFSQMLMTVYYPLMRYYFPQANGNWDGAIIHSILAIAIFTDNRQLFNQAKDHLLHGPVNGSLFKYIYPSGQCQESPRDQAHVQLGLGEFAGAAQIAFTQGVDVFAMANNRLAKGYEYTAQFLLGEKPQCYCIISERAKNLRDDYEYVYRHYAAVGVTMPFTKMASDSIRPQASRSVLSSVRQPGAIQLKKQAPILIDPVGSIAGAVGGSKVPSPVNAIMVVPGESIQQALDAAAGTGRWVVAQKGLHTLPAGLRIPSGITLAGEGIETILFLDPSAGRDAIVNAVGDLHDVTLRDFVLEGANNPETGTDPNSRRSFRSSANRGGILFLSPSEGAMKNIQLTNLTVRNCTYNGVFVSGANGIKVTSCDFTENGASVVPGPKLQHNLLITHCTDVVIEDSRLDTSPHGSGLALSHCRNVVVINNEIARNGHYGVLVSESNDIEIKNNLIEANDRSGVMMEYLHSGSSNISVLTNRIQYNHGYAVESYAVSKGAIVNNNYEGNGKSDIQTKISSEKIVILE